MHRNFVISGSPEVLRELAASLAPLAEIITLALDEEGSLKPRGAVLNVQALNRSADEVLRRVAKAVREGAVVVAIGSSTSLIDVQRQSMIDYDADEMLWEEMQQNLRNQGRVSFNSMALMALGGVICAAGLPGPPLVRLLAFVSGSIIAPGFDPIAGIPLGVVLGIWPVVRRAAGAAVVGYCVTTAAAAATFALLRLGHVTRPQDVWNEAIREMLQLNAPVVVIVVAASIAGAIMVVSLRDVYVVGPLIALVLVPTASVAGCAMVAGRWAIARSAGWVMLVDAFAIVAAGFVVFWLKQKTAHRRRPLA